MVMIALVTIQTTIIIIILESKMIMSNNKIRKTDNDYDKKCNIV